MYKFWSETWREINYNNLIVIKLKVFQKCVDRKSVSGKSPFIATKKFIKKLRKWFDQKSGVSLRKVARRLN